MKLEQLLREHVLHRTTLVDQGPRLILKCVECTRTFDLTPLFVAAGSTSTSQLPLGLNDPDACPDHAGQPAHACGPCRAENVEAPPMERVLTGTDPRGVPEWQAARDALAAKKLDRANGATS